jgi:hypothetical protein
MAAPCLRTKPGDRPPHDGLREHTVPRLSAESLGAAKALGHVRCSAVFGGPAEGRRGVERCSEFSF